MSCSCSEIFGDCGCLEQRHFLQLVESKSASETEVCLDVFSKDMQAESSAHGIRQV